MTERVPLARFMPYGAPDLLVAARPDLARALVLASFATACVFALFGLLRLAHPAATAVPELPTYIIELPPAPPVAPVPMPRVPVTPAQVVSSNLGRVVPDEQVPQEMTFAPPDEIRPYAAGDPDGIVADGVRLEPAAPETMPAFGTWQALEQLPQAIRTVKPDYPAFAREAMVEGWVSVHLLVGRDGRIVDVRLDERRHVPMLDAAALEAARRFEFQPALSNGRAVAAWVTVPFHFTLH